MAIILENTPWEYAVDGAKNVSRLVYDSRHAGTIFVQITNPNPGFKVGDTITYMKDDIYFTGKIWYIYAGPTATNLYVKHPDAASLNGTVGGVIHFGVVQPVLKSTGDTSGNGYDPGMGSEPGIAAAGIMARVSQYKTPLLIGGALVLAFVFRKKIFGKK